MQCRAYSTDDTTVKGDIEHSVQCGERELLSSLIPNAFTYMGLDLLPRASAPESSEFPRGMIHRESELCPFKDDNNPKGILATCCSFRGNETALYLLALGMGALAIRAFEDKSPEDAIEYANELRQAVETLRKFWIDAAKRAGRPVDPSLEGVTAKVPGAGWEFPVNKALQEIEACAKWHAKTGRLQGSVKTWF